MLRLGLFGLLAVGYMLFSIPFLVSGATAQMAVNLEAPPTAEIVVGTLDLPYNGPGMFAVTDEDLIIDVGGNIGMFALPRVVSHDLVELRFPNATAVLDKMQLYSEPTDVDTQIVGYLWLEYDEVVGELNVYIWNDLQEFEQTYTVEHSVFIPGGEGRGTEDCPAERVCCECGDYCSTVCTEDDRPYCSCQGERSRCRCIDKKEVVVRQGDME